MQKLTGAAPPSPSNGTRAQIQDKSRAAPLVEKFCAPVNFYYDDPFIGMTAGSRFHVTDVLGEGGMGRIYSAIDGRTGRRTAIKVASETVSTTLEKSTRYLERETRALSELRHDNIVGYIGHGKFGGRAFLALEHIEGDTLHEHLIINGTLEPESCRSIFMQMCDALEAAHQKGIVHADVKPGNVFLARGEDGSAMVKLFDFGMVKFMDGDGDPARAPEPGIIIGTIAYMAPEQIMLQDFDHRADIYALGVMMYVALSGVLPYDGKTDWDIVNSKTDGKEVPLRKRCPGLSAEIEAVVMRALERKPDDRFQSAADMRKALSSIAL